MRICKFYLLLAILSLASNSIFGKNTNRAILDTPFSATLEIPDTTCGLVDTVFQLTFPTCAGDADATATIQFENVTTSLLIQWDNGVSGATATGLSVGKHFVTVTDLNGCSFMDSVIIEDKPPLSYTISENNARCIGVNNGAISISDTSSLSYVWNTGDSTNMLSNLAAGVYQVSITDTLSCEVIETIIVGTDTTATAMITGVDATCLGINNGRAVVNDSLNLTGYTYEWSNGVMGDTLDSLRAGTYFVLATSQEGCLAADSIDIGVQRSVPLEISLTNASCAGVADGSISINDTLDVTNYQFGWNTGATTQTISNLSAGEYSVAVADSTGCIAATTIVVSNSSELTFTSSITPATCDVAANGSISINDTSDVTGLSFAWSTGDSTQMINGLRSDTYTITVTDSMGCMASDSLVVGISPTLSITGFVSDAFCNGVNNGSITANSNNTELSFAWNTGDSTQTIADLAPGNYSVVATDTFGCIATDTFTIALQTDISLTANTIYATCNGVNNGNIDLALTAGIDTLSILWSTGDTTQSINGLASGNYSVTVTDSRGCIEQRDFSLGLTDTLGISATITDVSCAGLSNGNIAINENDNFTFAWNTGDSTQSISNIAEGNYAVTVTDARGCIANDSFTVAAQNSLSITLNSTNVSCSGIMDGSVSVNQGEDVSHLTIRWDTGDSTQIVNNVGIGAYTATVTDTTGCTAVQTILVQADSSLQISLTGNAINCSDINDGRVSAAVIGIANNDDLTFQWNTGDTTATITNLAPGTYDVTVTDAVGCFGAGSTTLDAAADTIRINFVVSPIACMDTVGSGAILAAATGGSGSFEYSWNTGDNTAAINQLLAGTYILTVTDSLGCTLTDSTMLINPPDLIVNATTVQNATCTGTQDGSAMVNVSGGTAPYQIQWNTGIIAANLQNLDPGLYTVTVSDEAGCTIVDSITIEQTTSIQLITTEISSASSENDADGVATVIASGGQAPYTFNWDNGATGDNVTTLSPGIHIVIAEDNNGCTAMDSVEIGFFSLQVNIIEVRNLRCNGDANGRATASPINGTAPFTYEWSTGDTTAVVTNLTGGMHSVIVTDANGDRGRASVSITQPNPIYFNLEIVPPGCPTSSNGRITINATGTVGNPLYDFGVGVTTEPFILGITPGVKTYRIIDGNNCRADTTFTIEAVSPNPPVPNFGIQNLGLVATFSDSTLNAPFSYLWKFGDGTTSELVNPIHQYPDTGNYEVCLIVENACDIDSLCRIVRIDPIPVPAVELNFGRDTSSLSGQFVHIPVVVGAFDDLAAISGTFELSNPNIGTIQGVRDFNLPGLIQENFAFQQNLINLDWSIADTSSLVSLPVGTQLFVIDLLLTGNSNECTEIIATNTETPLVFSKVFMGNLVPAPFTITSAEICVAPTVSIAGNISREENVAISGVTISTNGNVAATTMTDGNYALPGLPGGTTFTIAANKSDELLVGVTTFDIVRILRHILTKEPLTSPYKIIAADVDNSGSVTSLDLVQLQRLILEQIDAFPNNQPWRFVPEGYAFTNPSNPLEENFPESITLNRLEVDTANIDFVAIKIGDVVDDASPRNARFLPKSMGFNTTHQTFKAGQIVRVPINFEVTQPTLGFQIELGFDPQQLAFIGTNEQNALSISDKNLGQKNIENGRLKMIWINQNQLPIPTQEDGLFQLEFKALTDGDLATALQIVEKGFPAQFFSQNDQTVALQNIRLNFVQATTETVTETSPPNTNFARTAESATEGGCSDGLDNDNDGLIDCADADCFCECNMQDNSNLILNPDAEMPIIAPIWEMISGDWTTRGANPSPQNGASYFYSDESDNAQLTQVVDLSMDADAINQGIISYAFAGYVRSFDQVPTDEAQIIIEYRNANDSTLTRFDSGVLRSTSGWQLVTDTTLAPAGTTVAIISLLTRKINGSKNDAYFDNLSLTRITSEACNNPCENIEILTLVTDAIPNGMGGTANAMLLGGNGDATFTWSTGATTNEVSDLAPGTYRIEATDSIGCTVMDSLEVGLDSTYFANINTIDIICAGDSSGSIIVEIIGGTAPFTITWSDSTLMGDTLQNLPSGDYMLTVTDAEGMEVMASTTLQAGAAIQLNTADSKIVNESCPNATDGQLSLVAEGGTAPYTYILNSDTTDNGVYLGLSAGNYTVNITDANGCTIDTEINVGLTLDGPLSAAFTNSINENTVTLNSSVMDSTATYNWMFGDGNASTEINPTHTYTVPGAYEICLSVTNDCGTEITCQTVTVGITGPVTFIINDLNGTANDTVIVPVTVRNFVDVVSYQKTIQILDTSIARIVGVHTPNLEGLTTDNFYQIDDHTVTTVWYDASGLGQTVPNHTVLYNLMVMIDSQIDTCVGIGIVNAPVAGQVAGIMGNEVAEVPFETIDGEVCTTESLQVTGNIARETGSAVPGVQINVSNFNKTPTTNINGNYVVEKLRIGGDYELTPYLNTPLLESVSTFDIVLINRHILGTRPLDSPYKQIAADINRSGTITVFDLVLIQRAILGLNADFPGNAAYRFIPKDYEFMNPTNPLEEDFPESITITDAIGDMTNQDFIAVKIADVSYNVPTGSRSGQNLTLQLDNQYYKTGDIISVPVSTADLPDIAGFQLELDFDKDKLALMDIVPAKTAHFTTNNIGLKYASQGKIQMIWVNPDLEISSTSPTLFTLQFRAKTDGMLSNNLQLGNRYLTSESYSDNLNIGNIALNFSETTEPTLQRLQIYPNPSKGPLTVSFANPKHEKVQLLLYNLTGQVVKTYKDIEGTTLELDLSTQTNGTYLLMLKKTTGVEVQRLIINRVGY